ncbi:hypothetical protein K490DRAFT_65081 [Saccharata proteae CBS 121410]|uniref:SRP9 domain-containing protein n=1 Tax=Saccharata proteae CBS 121410 TaxID=1314787 RepID=A0A9P4HVX1_9PEZI|nr:hypothetical protein K490DRAFT_65081 [Saccharata proteae CBS 121410]
MPYFTTSQEWFEQSALLLQARPTTTRIVTKYSLLHSRDSKNKKRKVTTSRPVGEAPEDNASGAAQAPPATKAALTLKTYDTASGVCLKYQTVQAAQVGRLVASLERLARVMAALPQAAEDASMPDVPLTEQGTGTNTPLPEAASTAKDSKPAQGGGGAGKKKKKGKK